MSSSTKHNKKHATIERPHIKRVFAKTKETIRRVKIVRDDSSPLETDSTDLKKKTRKNAKYDKTKSNQSNESLSSSAEDNDMPPHKNKKTKSSQKESKRKFSSSDSEDSENNYDKQQKLSEECTKSEKHKGNTKHRKGHSVLRSEKSKNKESESSDSEAEVHGRCSKEREKRRTTSGSVPENFISLLKEEADSSSGKEFQLTKLSRGYNKIKKSSEMKGNYTKSNLESTKSTGKSMISEKQCIRFKSCVTKILNKFKEVCSDYELRMESVKWKHLKKELVYQESAKNIIDKAKDVISKLKVELDSQEKELVTSYNEWYQECNSRNDEDSSTSENESLEMVESEDKLDQAKNKESSLKENTVSECDNEEIFSGVESEETRVEKDGKRIPSTSVNLSEKPTDDDDEDEEVLPSSAENASPILGSNRKKKASHATHSKSKLETVHANKGNFAMSTRSEDERMDDSLEDMFDETIIENTEITSPLKPNESKLDKQKSSESREVDNEAETTKSDPNEDINLLKDKEHTTESVNEDSSTEGAKSTTAESLFSQETLGLKTDDTESTATVRIEKFDNNSLDGLSEEERAKKALLESDSESLINEESSSEKSNRVPAESDLQQNCTSQLENVRSRKKDKNKSGINSVHENDSSNQNNDIGEAYVSVECAPLDLNSDKSVLSPPVKDDTDKKQCDSDNSENMHAKAKLLISSNSENSSSDNDEELQISSTDSSLKKQEKKENNKKDILKEDHADSDISISERVKIRRINVNSKYNSKSDEKLIMQCRVSVKRLPKKILKKYGEALSKSRQYLKDKNIDSLIDLDKLKKDSKKGSNSPRSALSKKKTNAAKQEEDSLMDHLKKVENGEFHENIQDDDYENSNSATKLQTTFATTAELMMEADDAVKKNLLNSDSDIEMRKDGSENSSSEKEEKTKAKDTTKKELSKKDKEKESSSDKEKSAWRRNKLLTMKLSSDSDSDAEREKWDKKKKKVEEMTEENDIEHSDAKDTTSKRKRRPRRKILDSDSDGDVVNLDSDSGSAAEFEDNSSDSSLGKKKTRKRKTHKSSSSDSSLPEKKSKQKRKRIKNVNTDSDSDDNDKTPNSQGTPGKKGRKNIRKVIKDKQVADDTKQAAKEEEERLKRIAERQKLYNEMYEARLADEEKVEKLVLDFDPETKEELISVHTNLVKRLKPHQAKGIKFMWDSCFESLERMNSSSGSGCIIAHCMGLGKTLQVITLIHTLLANDKTGIKTVMIVCPLSTVLNWVNEFKLWFKDVENADDIEIYELTKLKQNIERKYQLESWQRTGGVLIIGYEMFRNLTGTNNKMRKSMKEAVLQYLVDPGPDLIVCDEGHLLKNEETALSKCMKRIKTLRRIVLTGTPLQNNLIEYHCMVQFVKPSLLGTKKEFLNRFVNPITNGQFDDSTEYDVKIMKKRAYVLHKMLKGCVQRFDYSVLTPFLPPKQEYVIFVRLTDVQIKMYRHYLDNFARQQRVGVSLFADFQALQRIWTHPVVLRLNAEKVEKMNEKRCLSSESEGSLKDFIHDSDSDSESSESSSKSDSSSIKSVEGTVTSRRNTRSNNNPDLETPKLEENEKKEEEWWSQFTEPEQFEDLRISAKLALLFSILKESEQIGDKVLVFSQSLYSLTLIEKFLEKIDNETQAGTSSEYIDGHSGSWSLGLDYFRLDGQTSAENRSLWCKIFNQPSNSRARLFLISTRAGGLGINLTGANRVIIFDASWNPSHDVQSIFRVYRFGQKKPCYVYRFLAAGTMEEKIYNRQVTKLSLACRVVDEQQIERHYSNHDLSELYNFDLYTNMQGEKPTLNLPKDRLLAEIFSKYKDLVENYHEHDSLLENKAEEELDEEERKQAWLEYEEEKKGKKPMMPYQMIQPLSTSMLLNQYNVPAQFNANMDYEQLKELIRKDYPNATPEQQQLMTTRVLSDMYSYWEQQTYHNLSMSNQNTGMSIRPQAMSTAVPTTMSTAMPKTMSTAMPAVRPTQLGMQAPNLSRYPVMQNTNMNVQIRKEFTDADPKSGNVDDDVIEVSPTTTNKSKNQEE